MLLWKLSSDFGNVHCYFLIRKTHDSIDNKPMECTEPKEPVVFCLTALRELYIGPRYLHLLKTRPYHCCSSGWTITVMWHAPLLAARCFLDVTHYRLESSQQNNFTLCESQEKTATRLISAYSTYFPKLTLLDRPVLPDAKCVLIARNVPSIYVLMLHT